MEEGGEEKKAHTIVQKVTGTDQLFSSCMRLRKLWRLAAVASQEQLAISTLFRLESEVQIRRFDIRMLHIP